MNSNEELITRFYTCFKNKDYKGMQECYADEATFTDEAFVNLNARQVRAMWEMLLKSSKDMRLEFSEVQANDQKGKAKWVAHYTFSATGRPVVNRIQAEFEFRNGKIVKHRDHFDFYKWAKQSLGTPGLLLGWTGFMKRKIQARAASNLANYMTKNNL